MKKKTIDTGDDEGPFKQSFIDEIKRREKLNEPLIPFEEIVREFGVSTKKLSKLRQKKLKNQLTQPELEMLLLLST